MTDKKQDPHAELMRLAKNMMGASWAEGTPESYESERLTLDAFARTLTDRITELEAQLEAVGAGGVGAVADASITLDLKMATELLEMFGGEPAEITLQIGDGHSGKGVYAHYTDMPEEGAEFLGMPDDEAIPSTQPQQIAEPASDLHSAIMNLPVGRGFQELNINQRLAYKIGHRDARHAAAELVATKEPS